MTARHNGWNRRAKRGGTSQYLGVSWDGGQRRWLAYISLPPNTYLDSFTSEIDAALAYDRAATTLRGLK